MKTNYTSKNSISELIANLKENEILNAGQMISVRGGEGEDNGSEPIIIIPEGVN